jgi:hypothetical protein
MTWSTLYHVGHYLCLAAHKPTSAGAADRTTPCPEPRKDPAGGRPGLEKQREPRPVVGSSSTAALPTLRRRGARQDPRALSRAVPHRRRVGSDQVPADARSERRINRNRCPQKFLPPIRACSCPWSLPSFISCRRSHSAYCAFVRY